MTLECKNTYLYEEDKSNPYYREEMPRPMFEAMYKVFKQKAVGFLCQMDPTHEELYKTLLPKYDYCVEEAEFKDSLYESMCGCQDNKEPFYEDSCRGCIIKIATRLRFEAERVIYREQLDKQVIKKPIYVVALPRSGSTFTHTLMSIDKHANNIVLYEQFAAGSQTMTREGRLKIAQAIMGQVHSSGLSDDLNQIHSIDDNTKPEEELFHLEMLGLSYLFAGSIPRWEQYRCNIFKRDYTYAYKCVYDNFKSHLMEFPYKNEGDYLVNKAVCHFLQMAPFLNELNKDETESRIIWIHREPVDELKSAILLEMSVKGRYPNDLGKEDAKWVNDNLIKMNELCLKNACEIRDKWIKEKPERAKRICDIGFYEITHKPVETMKRIYKQFDMEWEDGFEDKIMKMVQEGDPQIKYGRKQRDPKMYTFNEDEVRERFKWYYERFGDYMPNYWGKKDDAK